MEYDIVSLGPARMDAFVQLPDEEVNEVCSIDKKRCMIELGFGDKIPVKSIEFAAGGNTANNAVGLTRLGHRVAMVATMGDGWTEKQALEILRQEGVNIDNISQQPGKFGFGVIIGYQGERTILSYYPEMDCDFSLKDMSLTSKWVYLTTAGQNYDCFYEDAVAWVKKTGARVAFNPGSRQIKDGVEKLAYAYRVTEILFVNREEGEKLVGQEPGADIKQVMNELHKLGPKTVIVTDGPDGTYLFDGVKFWHMPIVPAPVVERTGAGDAFGSGFLGAVLAGRDLREALRWGTVNSASVLGFVGPQGGLLTQEQMQEWLKKSEDVMPKEI